MTTRIPTQAEYEANEAERLYRKLEALRTAPLRDRREARADWRKMLLDPSWVRRNLDWLCGGSYGWAEHRAAWRIIDDPGRSNKAARLGILLAALDCACPAREAVLAYRSLARSEQAAIDRAILAEIAEQIASRTAEAALQAS